MGKCGGSENDVVMDMVLIRVGADDVGVVAFGEAPRQLTAEPVGFFRRDLAGDKGLPQMVGDHIVRTARSAGLLQIQPLCKRKFRVRKAAVALVACDEFSVFGLGRIFDIIENVADRRTDGSALADVQRHQACGCQIDVPPIL